MTKNSNAQRVRTNNSQGHRRGLLGIFRSSSGQRYPMALGEACGADRRLNEVLRSGERSWLTGWYWVLQNGQPDFRPDIVQVRLCARLESMSLNTFWLGGAANMQPALPFWLQM